MGSGKAWSSNVSFQPFSNAKIKKMFSVAATIGLPLANVVWEWHFLAF